jgi:hypothetical protein
MSDDPHSLFTDSEDRLLPLGTLDTLTFRWLAGILLGLLTAVVGFEMHTVSESLTEVRTEVVTNGKLVAEMQGQLLQNNSRLQRIEANQDKVLQSLGKR